MAVKKNRKPVKEGIAAKRKGSHGPKNTSHVQLLAERRNAAQRQQDQQALEESENRYKTLFESSPEGILIADVETRKFQYANPAACRMLGYSEEELTNMRVDDIHPKEALEHVISEFEAQARGQKTLAEDIPCLKKDGTLVYTDINTVKSPVNGRECNIGFFRDITERKQAEKDLLFKTTILEAQSETSIDGILAVDRAGKSILLNKRFGEMWGIPQPILDARDDKAMIQYVLGQLEEPNKFLGQVEYLYTHEDEKSRDEIRFKDGKVFDRYSSPLIDSRGVYNGRIWYFRDITSRKQAERDLRTYREHLEDLVRARTADLTNTNEQLLQEIERGKRLEQEILNISDREQRRVGRELHDSLGQQLTGIGFMTKALEQKLAAKSADNAAEVRQINKLVKQAMEQARDLARGLHPVDLDAGGLVSSLQELAEATQKLFRIRCTFKCDKFGELESTGVAVHLYRLTQEAITNAIKHGKTKDVQIDLVWGKDESTLTVKNDGLDFPREFEVKGRGMGLQIMNHRVNILCGSLDIHKADDGGTIVICKFPNKK